MKNKGMFKSFLSLFLLLALLVGSFASCVKEAVDSNKDAGTSDDIEDNNGTSDGEASEDPKYSEEKTIIITELMYPNIHTIADENGNYCPWVEILNTTDEKIELSEYRLVQNENSWTFPSVELEPQKYALVFMNGKNDGLGCGFELEENGHLYIYKDDVIYFDAPYVNKTDNCSFIIADYAETATPTPGYADVREGSGLMISEIMSSNESYPIDGTVCDYFELFNSGEATLDLSEFFASDDKEKPYDYNLPSVQLAPGEYYVVPCRDDDEEIFRFSKTGDSLYITRRDGVLESSAEFGALEDDTVYTYDGTVSAYPSPGYENTYAGMSKYITDRKGLVINEVLASNNSAYATNRRYYDIVEIINNSDEDILLSDYYISDKRKTPLKSRLPEKVLAPNECYVLVASGNGGEHLDFKISSDGERLFLTREEDMYISDVLIVPPMQTNTSWGRSGNELVYFSKPSIGKANGSGYVNISADPVASSPSGFYTSALEITLSGEGKIYYTLDGSRPSTKSKLYGGETIKVSSNTVIRAFCVDGDKIASNTVAYNYFFIKNMHDLPVVSVNTTDAALFGDSGIYTNYSWSREVEANVAMFENGSEEFSVNCGLKIFGGGSRELPKKSFQLKFRSQYGAAHLNYDLFDSDINSFNSLVLRAGEDYNRSIFRDELQTWIAANAGMEVLTQKYRFCVLYLNGKYWGIYCIKERIDEHFVSSYTGDETDDITVISMYGTVDHGSSADWFSLMKFAANNDLTVEKNYRYIEERVNFNSLADWMIIEMYTGNQDLGNIRYYKGTDGKWNLILYDMDWGFNAYWSYYQNYYHAGVAIFMRSTWKGGYLTRMLNKLSKNDNFMEIFLTRLSYHMNVSIKDEEILAKIDELEAELSSEIAREKARWGGSYNGWKTNVNELRLFVTNRNNGSRSDEIIKQTIKFFSLDEETVYKFFGEDYMDIS